MAIKYISHIKRTAKLDRHIIRMKQNLLKYGLVMVLAMIASTGLLWAEKDTTQVSDSCITIQNDSVPNITNTTIKSEEPINIVQWCESVDWIQVLDFIKNYRKEILLLVVVFLLAIALICYIVAYVCRLINGQEFYLFRSVYSWRKNIFVLLFFVLSLFVDSSWFYLVVAALIIYYLDRRKICPDLLDGIVRVIRNLQGKMDVTPMSDQEIKERDKQITEEYKKLLELDGAVDKVDCKLSETQIEQFAQDAKRVENIAWDYYKQFYPEMQKNIRLSKNGRSVDVEGLVTYNDKNVLLVIKYCNSLLSMAWIALNNIRVIKAARALRKETGKGTKIIQCIICRDSVIYRIAKVYFIQPGTENISIEFYTIDTLLQKVKEVKNLINY